MKVGDLVELSSMAKKLKWTQKFIGKIGLIYWVNDSRSWYRVNWIGDKPARRYPLYEMFSRSHLKYAKKRKEKV